MFARFAFLIAAAFLASPALAAQQPAKWWAEDVEQALAKAGDNRAELEKALTGVPKEQRKGMAFLVANMPEGDLKSLKADFLLSNTELAYKARNTVPWGK